MECLPHYTVNFFSVIETLFKMSGFNLYFLEIQTKDNSMSPLICLRLRVKTRKKKKKRKRFILSRMIKNIMADFKTGTTHKPYL